MSDLQRFDKDGIELIIDTTTGESFASISGYARMADKDKSTISRRLETVAAEELKTAEILTTTGAKTVALITESLICEWLPKDNPKMASALLRVGVRVFLHKMAGYEVKSTAIAEEVTQFKLPQTYLEALQELVEKEKVLIEKNKDLELAARLLGESKLAEVKAVESADVLAAKIKATAHFVEFAEDVSSAINSISFNEFAKAIGTGRNRLFDLMRKTKVILIDSPLPYQKWIDAGYFEVSEKIIQGTREDGTDYKHVKPYALITGKGQIWLRQRLNDPTAYR